MQTLSNQKYVEFTVAANFILVELDDTIEPVLASQGLEMPAMLAMPEPPEEDEDDEDLEDENE